jgi:LacI family kdg operon repressor
MDKAVTINDIAKLAKVSKTTVSRFLNGKYDGMSEETRLRVQDVIKESDYRPNRQARALKAKYSSVIGIAVTDISNSYNSRILKGIMDCLKETEYQTIILDSDLNRERELSNVDRLIDEQIDGLIIQPLGESSEKYNSSISDKLPVIQFDRYVEPLRWPAVVSDNFVQSRNLGKLIKEKGYQRVIVVTPPIKESSPRVNRYKGLLNAVSGSKIDIKVVETSEIRDVISQDKVIWEEVRSLIDENLKTAVFTFNGSLLYGLVKFLNDNLLTIPSKVGVVGYDDGSLGELISPGITAIEQNPVMIGYTAASILLDQIENGKSEAGLTCIDSRLNIRQSL